MPGLPSQFTATIPATLDVTLAEVSCRLVGTRDADAAGAANLSQLILPNIQVDLSVVDAALSQHMPVLELRSQAEDAQDDSAEAAAAAAQVPGGQSSVFQLLRTYGRSLLARLPGPLQSFSHELPPRLLAWHCSRPVLAIGHSSSGAVLLYDLTTGVAGPGRAGVPGVLTQPQQVLTHQLQQQVCCLAWRPVHSSMLAVGVQGGVALWSLGKLPLSASAVSRAASGPQGTGAAAGAGGSAGAGGWVTFLDFKQGCRVSSLSWSPDGTKLAGSSSDCNRLLVWDVSLGVGASLRLGLHPVPLISWSPDGNYLFAADRSGHFYLYETATWSVRRWDSPPGAMVTGAVWAPDSSVLLLSLSGSNSLVGVHLVGQAPKLTEQMLPVLLPGVSDAGLTGPSQQDGSSSGSSSVISSIAWDPSGSRLAVVLAAPHPAAGLVALYSTSFVPVVTCNLIGFVQPGTAQPAAQSASQKGSSTKTGSEPGSSVLQLAFAPVPGKAKAAGVLSVGQASGSSSTVCRVLNVPMYF